MGLHELKKLFYIEFLCDRSFKSQKAPSMECGQGHSSSIESIDQRICIDLTCWHLMQCRPADAEAWIPSIVYHTSISWRLNPRSLWAYSSRSLFNPWLVQPWNTPKSRHDSNLIVLDVEGSIQWPRSAECRSTENKCTTRNSNRQDFRLDSPQRHRMEPSVCTRQFASFTSRVRYRPSVGRSRCVRVQTSGASLFPNSRLDRK